VISGYREGAWIRFTYNGQEAFIASRLTSPDPPPRLETLYITKALCVRPYKNASESLGILTTGKEISGYREGAWIRFTYNGQEAFIASRLTSPDPPPRLETLYITKALCVRPYKNASESLGILTTGKEISGYREGAWIRFTYNGQEAFIASRLTSPEETLYITKALCVRPHKNASESLGILTTGKEISGYREGAWIRFTYNGQEAFIASRLTSPDPPPRLETLYITKALCVRPYKNASESLGILTTGKVISGYREGAWIRFTYNGQEAFIASRLTSPEAPLTGTLKRVLDEARKWIGVNEKNNGHYYIIDTYNNQPNLPRGMRVGYDAHWCDVFVSFIGIRTNTTHILGSEAYVPYHMNYFMNKGQWIENGSIAPRPGDIAFFNWAVSSQPNYAVPGHISIVESVHDGYFYSIDGNVFQEGVWGQGHVVRRKYITGAGTIRGFARPAYQ